jgi:hypothetical protein
MKRYKILFFIILFVYFNAFWLYVYAEQDSTATPREKAMLLALTDLERGPAQEKQKTKYTESEEEDIAPPLQKGAWVLEKGQLYGEIYTKYYWHNQQFDEKANKKRWDYDRHNEIRANIRLNTASPI